MNKKVISSVLAGAMALSTLGVVASAADSKNTYSAKADLMETTINANVPSDLEAKINPYGAAVVKAASTTEVAKGYADGIISPTYAISNLSTAAGLKVSATAKITPSSTVALMTKPMDNVKLEKATEKQVFAFLNTTTDSTGEFSGTGAAATTGTVQPIFADTKYVGNDNQLAFTEDGAVKTGIMTIDALATGSDPKAAASGFFYVGGQCTPNPEEAWTTKDTVTVDLILDLSPSMGKPADLTLAGIAITGGGKIEFDAATKTYTLAAASSATKFTEIKATANAVNTNVYVKLNGEMMSATTATVDKNIVTITAGAAAVAGDAAISPVVKATGSPNTFYDWKAGDKVEFIVVSAKTFESTTYTIVFE